MKWLFLVTTVFTSPAFADAFQDGNELYGFLQTQMRIGKGGAYKTLQAAYEGGLGQGYVAGVVDAKNGAAFCVPSGLRFNQTEEITFNYLNSHPEERHLSAWSLVVTAMSEKFPCRKVGISK